jgi:hypothetical protein
MSRRHDSVVQVTVDFLSFLPHVDFGPRMSLGVPYEFPNQIAHNGHYQMHVTVTAD